MSVTCSFELNPQRRKERTIDALLRRLDRMAQSRPMLMLFEDVQWADPSSLELLDALIDQLAKLPILLVISFRTEFTALDRPRRRQPDRVEPVESRHSEVLAAQVTTDRALTRDLLEQIITQTDGVPLFIEELTKAVLEAVRDPMLPRDRSPFRAAAGLPDGAALPAAGSQAGSADRRGDRPGIPACVARRRGITVGDAACTRARPADGLRLCLTTGCVV